MIKTDYSKRAQHNTLIVQGSSEAEVFNKEYIKYLLMDPTQSCIPTAYRLALYRCESRNILHSHI